MNSYKTFLSAKMSHPQAYGRSRTKMALCRGDSGSPLSCKDDTSFLCGIGNASDRFCGQRRNISGLFTNVSSHFDWITNNIHQLQLRYNFPCNYFQCMNEFCVIPSSVNNGINDCGDGPDEKKGIRELFHRTSHNYKIWDIQDTKYKCHHTIRHPDRYRLIDTEYLCDGVLNCPANHSNICNNYKKNSSLCSPTTQTGTRVLSKFNNCIHRTDETNCTVCRSESIKCPNENKCIRPQSLCNGVQKCIFGHRTCNGVFDRDDQSVEKNCIKCRGYSFHCKTENKCVPFSSRCDGKKDCLESEDEINCKKSSKESLFHCSKSRRCIEGNLRYDGKTDSEDNEDGDKPCPTIPTDWLNDFAFTD